MDVLIKGMELPKNCAVCPLEADVFGAALCQVPHNGQLGIEFDGKKLEDLIHLVYPDAYKKKLSTLRAQQTKLSQKKLEWEQEQ